MTRSKDRSDRYRCRSSRDCGRIRLSKYILSRPFLAKYLDR